MRCVRLVLMAAPLSVLAACSSGGPRNAAPVRAGCEDVSGQGVASGAGYARLIAQANLRHQGQDLRGYMLKDGYRTVRISRANVTCSVYSLGLGLKRCVARAQMCGH
jgi:hypothetical protein